MERVLCALDRQAGPPPWAADYLKWLRMAEISRWHAASVRSLALERQLSGNISGSSGRLRTSQLICQPHYERQSYVQARDIVIVKVTDLAANA
jgi:hypothetical protein